MHLQHFEILCIFYLHLNYEQHKQYKQVTDVKITFQFKERKKLNLETYL